MTRISLRTRLTWLNISVMFVVLVPLGIFTYQRESHQISALLDGRLAQAGRTLATLISHGARVPVLVADPQPVTPAAAIVVRVDREDDEPEVGYQVYDSAGTPLVVTGNLVNLASATDDDIGLRTVVYEGTPWRMFTLRGRSGLLVRIGERFDTRESLTRGLVVEHSLPLIIGLPLLALLISLAVRRGLRPLEHLTGLLRNRRPGDRDHIRMDDATSELTPLIATMNQQFETLEDALERERRFNADVAHELRTPLTATMIHLESAAIARERVDVDAAMGSAQESLVRLARRIEQILELAKLEASAATGQLAPCDLIALVKDTIEDLAPLIVEKDITMGFVYGEPVATMMGHEAALAAMFRNIIENALRYVLPGGSVEVTLTATDAAIQVDVRDDGPGIPAERREKVFNRFHRESPEPSNGYGLGLDIVKRAARRHGASVDLFEVIGGSGLHVRVILPRVPAAP